MEMIGMVPQQMAEAYVSQVSRPEPAESAPAPEERVEEAPTPQPAPASEEAYVGKHLDMNV